MTKHHPSIKNTILLVIFIFPLLVAAQKVPDSLKSLSYDILTKKFEEHPEHTKVYADAYLKKAKNEKDSLQMIKGYELYLNIYKGDIRIQYIDSIINVALKNRDYEKLSETYLRKGVTYFVDNKNFKEALNNYLNALKYVKLTDNEERLFYIKYNIAALKDQIGDYKEALILEKEIFNHQKKYSKNIDFDLIALLATTYRNLNVLDSSSYYNKIGLEESKRNNDKRFYGFFLLNEAVVDFEKKDYQNALDSIIKSVPLLKKTKNLTNLAISYNYLGKLYLLKDKKELAVTNFKKTDSIFKFVHDLHPEARSAYEDLINYYKKENNTEQQLKYVNQLLKLDSILSSNSIYISKRITKEYDIPKLETEKENLLTQFNKSKKSFTTIIIILSIFIFIVLFGLYYQYKKRQLYKDRFERLVNTQEPITSISEKKEELPTTIKEKKGISVPESIVESILKQLAIFEEEKGFTTLGLTSQILAKKFKTNTKYLSMVVNHFKEQSFINYLNNLRIDYTVERLKTDTVFRRYTIQAISKEVGFNNTESFSKSFYKKTGIKPSFFVKQLNKQQDT